MTHFIPHRWRGAGWAMLVAMLYLGPVFAASIPTGATASVSAATVVNVAAPPAVDATSLRFLDEIQRHMGSDPTLAATTVVANTDPVRDADVPTMGGMVLRMALSLCVVLGLIGLAAVALRALRNRQFGASAAPPARVLSRVPLGGKSSMVFVDMLDRVLVLGDGEGGPRLLLVLDDPAELDALRGEGLIPEAAMGRRNFKEQLRRTAGNLDDEARSSAEAFERLTDAIRRNSL